MAKGRWEELRCKCVAVLYIQLHSTLFSSLEGRPFWMLFMYVSVCILLSFVVGKCHWHIYTPCSTDEQVQNSALMIFIHNSIHVNSFHSAQLLLTYLSGSCYVFYSSFVNYYRFRFMLYGSMWLFHLFTEICILTLMEGRLDKVRIKSLGLTCYWFSAARFAFVVLRKPFLEIRISAISLEMWCSSPVIIA